MTKAALMKSGLLRVSEVSRAAGVSLPTIHYYVREGLLIPAVKTARNMAYYSRECIEDIRLIKELQSKRFLPLSAIKMIINARHEGQDIDHLIEMRSFLDDIFQPVGKGTSMSLSLDELIDATGLSATDIHTLEGLGLLMPVETLQGRFYDDIDVRVARIVRELAEFGLYPADLDVYRQYVEAIRNEARTIHEMMHKNQGMKNAPIFKIVDSLNSMKSCLAHKIYRQTVMEQH